MKTLRNPKTHQVGIFDKKLKQEIWANTHKMYKSL